MKKFFFIVLLVACHSACFNTVHVGEGNTEDIVRAVCERVNAVDFTIRQTPIDHMSADFYKAAYLKILKNEIPTINYYGEKEYFKDLYKIGNSILENQYYFHDLDGDSLPELGVKSNGGYTYIIKYSPNAQEFSVLFKNATMYYTILGTGQLWYHNGLHVGYISDRYEALNKDNQWAVVVAFERSAVSQEEIDRGFMPYYCVSIDEYKQVDVSEDNWNAVTKDFFDMTKNALPARSFHEVFSASE